MQLHLDKTAAPVVAITLSTMKLPEPHRGRRILIVDDEEGFRDGMADLLDMEGYAVAVARDAIEAVRLVPEFRPEEGDPFTVLSRIATEVRADLVVVGASGGLGHRFAGSVAVRLVKTGRWPVTVVP